MIFDITTELKSKEFLSEFLSIDTKEIDKFIERATDNVFLDEFLEFVDREVDGLSIDNLKAHAIHITSNDDSCNSIRENGIVNLKHALTMDTPLSRFLRGYDISFYIYNNLMCIKDRFHDITFDSLRYESESPSGKLNQVARKIYSDYQINSFFCLREAKAYDGHVNLRPEIIGDISKLGKNPDEFEKSWINSSKAYMVKFLAPIEDFAFYSFYMGLDAFKEDHADKIELKGWIVNQAIRVIWEKYHYGKLPIEIMGYLKSEVLVSPANIIEIRAI